MEKGKWKTGQDKWRSERREYRSLRIFRSERLIFGARVITLGRFLYRQPDVPRRLTDQLVGCGTSIGANVEEGQAAQSRADFIAKYGIALKEAKESCYRLRLFLASKILTPQQAVSLLTEADELAKMIAKAIVTARKNLATEKGKK